MAQTVNRKRTYIGAQNNEVFEISNLIAIQTESYKNFLQIDKIGTKEGPDPEFGIENAFQSIFNNQDNPNGKKGIISPSGDLILSYKSYNLDFETPNIHFDEYICKKKGLTYSVPLKATLVLENTKTFNKIEKEIYFGDIPLMTERGTFIINGSERVIVSQIHRSPGVVAQYDRGVYSSRIIPSRGSWLEFEIDDKHDGIYTVIDRKKKVLSTIFLRAIGLSTRADIVKAFYNKATVDIKNPTDVLKKELNGKYSYCDYFNKGGEKIIRSGDKISPSIIDTLSSEGIESIDIVDLSENNNEKLQFDTILKCFEKEESYIDRAAGEDEVSEKTVLYTVFEAIGRSEILVVEAARKEINDMFYSSHRYDLGPVGRFKLNQRFSPESNIDGEPTGSSTLTIEDLVNTMTYLINVFYKKVSEDDIDHLGNRRLRGVGELVTNQFKSALQKIERSCRERMVGETDNLRPQDLIHIKPLVTALREFFCSSPLSQFMDQTNPLAELTHKRRITALGVGGLSRERAGLDVRDVHYTHYGRMCPIETPEGQNIGLILTLANYTKVTRHGFLETPYRRVVDGKATKEVKYLDALEEEKYFIASASSILNEDGSFAETEVSVRKKGDYTRTPAKNISYMDVSPKQVISVAASLIPFVEHDDPTRALMGSNMQRQAVPLLFPEAPRVGTGVESATAFNSGAIVKANEAGTVTYVSSDVIKVTRDNGIEDTYLLQKYQRSNQDTCITQHPIVEHGQKVEKDQVLADGPATDKGELALGRNILVGFVPWYGYNYEDAVLISERVVKDDVFTSVHIIEQTTEIRETKLGPEVLTRDIPNVGEAQLKDLDENGIIKVGSYVKTGSILVGKVTPKSETDVSSESKLLSAIFGERSRDVRNSSLKVPHGTEGVVIEVMRIKRDDGVELQPGVIEQVKVLIANKRKLRQGDKMAGRHGNKGVVSRILPEEDMPYMEDGTPLDVCLNPLGVPSRMNIGQLMETELGWAGVALDEWYNTPVFQSATMEQIEEKMVQAGLPKTSKQVLYDGRTGEKFENPVFCGYIYYLKLHHLVDDKMHARSTGPYSLVTQQPLGGKAQFGGQRFGEMEVWALEAYGAVNTLQEILTVKSDDMNGRNEVYKSIVNGESSSPVGTPEAFNVLAQEVKGLALDLLVYDNKGNRIGLTEREDQIINKKIKVVE